MLIALKGRKYHTRRRGEKMGKVLWTIVMKKDDDKKSIMMITVMILLPVMMVMMIVSMERRTRIWMLLV